jgi:hypothetical protein
VLSLCLSKCSLLLTIRALFTYEFKRQWWASSIAIATICAWGLASALAISVDCSPSFVVLGQQNVRCTNHVCPQHLITWYDCLHWLGHPATGNIHLRDCA